MGIHRLKHSFASGEVTPYIYQRADLAKNTTGAKSLVNFVIKPQGPITRRVGTRFVYNFGASPGKRTVLIPFVFNVEQSYILIFVHNGTQYVMYIAMDDGLVETSPGSGTPYTLNIPAAYDMTQVYYAQSNDVLYVVQEDQKPAEIQRTALTSWTFVNTTFTSAPASWTGTNYPSSVGFLEQRIAYAATPSDPHTIWLSKAGSFVDFSVSSPIVDDDAITFTLNSGQQNRIHWLSSTKNLVVGTIGSEWTVGGSGYTATTPTNIRAERHTEEGGAKMHPIVVGPAVLFVDYFKKKVFEFVYDYQYDSYMAGDLTIIAPHLFYEKTISDWSYQKRPDNLIWCVASDAMLLTLTYNRNQKVVGWSNHYLGGSGNVHAVACIPGEETGETETWFIVEREIGGAAKIYLEKLDIEFTSDDITDAHFLDSFLTYNGSKTKTITGLTHLIGETVGVLADGMVHPDCTVSAGGTITLGFEAEDVCVGYRYQSKVSPLFPDIARQDGTTYGRVQRITNVDIILHNSIGFKIGREEGKLEEVPFRTPQDVPEDALPLFSGTVHYAFPEGLDRDPELWIVQDDPLPLTVSGIIDTAEVYE